ncbi:conserved hypothetical protein [Candidatus Methylobacter favarea]|uniref:Lipoprotein n=1 Tax=Candidatus Methylobacter favarea TaxID=2707345 RepID=A0A8S0XF37_9GAMM|nr:hypothetical protein [Candidatus Methylobacter favarea]CAA9890254.1 conserved hypothetical protein [Candidatus Methylobacter favarea]
MKTSITILASIIAITLTACSTQEVRQTAKGSPAAPPDQSLYQAGANPPLTIIKDHKTLNLVRVMDGAACKNDFQGAKGEFLIYADPSDIERIKREKGPKVFSDFERKIQAFSTEVLQHAINATNLAEDPFSLGEDQAQEKLAKQLTSNFRSAVAGAVTTFGKETTLTIDIAPYPPSFVFYQKGCEATRVEPEST